MKPTQEQVEAAQRLCDEDFMPGRMDLNAVQGVAAFLAARDAERDARWEAFRGEVKHILNHAGAISRRLGVVHHEGNWAHNLRQAENAVVLLVGEIEAALANLGAEEKR